MSRRKIGEFTQEIIDTLELDISCGTPIYIGDSNIDHIQSRHPYEYEKYFCDIEDIIKKPDYVGQNPRDGSILFVRLYKIHEEYIRVAVKISPYGNYYAKTLHLLSTHNAERYITKGTLKNLTNKQNIV